MMYVPDLNTFYRTAAQANLAPVSRSLSADLETPVSVFLKLRTSTPCFLLESVERGEQVGRYSFIGINPFLVFSSRGQEVAITRPGEAPEVIDLAATNSDPLTELKRLMSEFRTGPNPQLPGFFGGAVGYLSYDMVRFTEKLPFPSRDELDLPDCLFMFPETVVVFDHVLNKMTVVAIALARESRLDAYYQAAEKIDAIVASLERPLPARDLPAYSTDPAGALPAPATSNFTRNGYESAVLKAKEYILAGDAFQVVVSQRLRRATTADPFNIYRALRRTNPSPYMFYLDYQEFQLIGSSPEMLVKLEGRRAETRPIAGTRPRGKNEQEDTALSAELLADAKERAEHLMLVDLGRNDIGRVCDFASVRVPTFMSVEKYSHVIHIVSSVTGDLKEGEDAFSLIRACFPAGTVSGAPKVRAMEIINELEGLKRGPYAGAVGYFGFTGDMDTCITIRTMVHKNGTVYLQGGAGIVADSNPASEYDESLRKLEALQSAITLAEAG